MGKKKPFIDKKKSSTYHLLHRSQRDVAGDVLDQLQEGEVSQMGMVLWPSPENRAETDRAVLTSGGEDGKLAEWRRRLSEAGLLDDGQGEGDPERYLKPITGTGTFLDASGRVGATAAVADPRLLAQQLKKEEEDDALLLEVQRQFESIPLTADCMDDDIAAALFGDFEEGDFEELNDDFVLDAAKEPEVDGDGDDGAFDFDEHVRRLMEKARAERADELVVPGSDRAAGHDWGKQDSHFFSKLKSLREREDGDGDSIASGGATLTTATPGVVPALSPDEERALCEKFEEALLEYESDAFGDCPEEEIQGPVPMEGDRQLEAALDDFLHEKEDEVFMQGTRHYLDDAQKRTGGSGFCALVGKQMVHASEIDKAAGGDKNPADDGDDPLAPIVVPPKLPPPPEEILIDGQSYFSERVRNPFDCESILSTYSNLDNNPVTIGSAQRRRHRKNVKKNRPLSGHEEEDEAGVAQIRLSRKTGLPLGVFPPRHGSGEEEDEDDEDNDDTFVSVNRGAARNRKETPEEKKARKAAIKRERQAARIQKKATKEVFREEFEKRAGDVISDDIAGKTVFRYS